MCRFSGSQSFSNFGISFPLWCIFSLNLPALPASILSLSLSLSVHLSYPPAPRPSLSQSRPCTGSLVYTTVPRCAKNKKALFVTVCLYYVANKRSIIWSQWSQQLFCVAAVKWRSEKWRDAKNEKRMKSIETRWRVDRQIERFPSLFPVTADFPPWGGQTRVANEWESWKKSPRWRICINCNWIE